MVSGRLKAHIPPEAGPANLLPLIAKMNAQDLTFPTVKSLLEFTEDEGLGSRTELQIFGMVGGVLQKSGSGAIALSDYGQAIARAKPDLQADLAHFLFYSGWDSINPRKRTELWGYRQISDAYWACGTVTVLDVASLIVEEIRNNAYEYFHEDVSLSNKSIRGVGKWLEALRPPVIEGGIFGRRTFCNPALLIAAIGWTAQQAGEELSIDMLLTPEKRDAVCRVCLLDPPSFDRVLDWAIPAYPAIIRPGTTAGVYGRFVRILKWPSIGDLVI